jgi:hypothetical protein
MFYRTLARVGLLLSAWFLSVDSVQAGGPCDAPPYDPLEEVTSAEAAMQMDHWAMRALRRDYRGRTCDEVQEVVDILIVRWLQAHPEIQIDLNGTEADWLMRTEGALLLRIKAEALAECKGRRRWFPRSWGGHPDDRSSQVRREDFVRRAGEGWGGRKK